MTALTALHENDSRLERASRRICNKLSGFLSPWLLEAGPFAKVEGRFKCEILDPAIKLHQDLRSSSHRYDTRPHTVIKKLSPKQILDEWELKDADTWQKPRGEKEVGKALYCLHPAVHRLRTQGRPPIVIVKAVMVVQPPRRRLLITPESSSAKHDLPRDSKSHTEKERQSSGKHKRDRDVESKRRGHHIEGTSKTSASKVATRQPLRRDSRDTPKDSHSPRSSANKTL